MLIRKKLIVILFCLNIVGFYCPISQLPFEQCQKNAKNLLILFEADVDGKEKIRMKGGEQAVTDRRTFLILNILKCQQ
jgi:hypothetical protein